MNYLYYKKLQRKEMIKNTIFILLIIVFATISTYVIYNKLSDRRDEILKSRSLDVIYHSHDGNKVTITNATPVSDYVGLSSKAYTFTVKNNTSMWVTYRIRIVNDEETVLKDGCKNKKIPISIMKVGIHARGEDNKILMLDDLKDGVLKVGKLAPLSSDDYTVRFWISEKSAIRSSKLHYHGLLEVGEE